MTLDEGYVKYQSFWTKAPVPHAAATEELETWRRPLHASGLIGYYGEHGIGYGNISIRCGEPGQFMISGTQTGHIEMTDKTHYALVTSYGIHFNRVCCVGPVQASSEAMTHAAIYELDSNGNNGADEPDEQAVIGRILELRKAGLSLRGIARELEKEDHKPRIARHWSHQVIDQTLRRAEQDNPPDVS